MIDSGADLAEVFGLPFAVFVDLAFSQRAPADELFSKEVDQVDLIKVFAHALAECTDELLHALIDQRQGPLPMRQRDHWRAVEHRDHGGDTKHVFGSPGPKLSVSLRKHATDFFVIC